MRARRIRAVICFQSAIGYVSGTHCSSERLRLPVRDREFSLRTRTRRRILWTRRQRFYTFYAGTRNARVSTLASSPLREATARLRDLLRIIAAVVLSFGWTAAPVSMHRLLDLARRVRASSARPAARRPLWEQPFFSGDWWDSLPIRNSRGTVAAPSNQSVIKRPRSLRSLRVRLWVGGLLAR